MKRTIAVIVITVLILGFATFEQVYFHNTISDMQTQTETLLSMVKSDPENVDSEDNLEKANEFLSFWDNHKHYYEMLLSHTYTIEVERNASVLLNHMEQNDYLMTSTDLSALVENCKMLRELITPHLHTIL